MGSYAWSIQEGMAFMFGFVVFGLLFGIATAYIQDRRVQKKIAHHRARLDEGMQRMNAEARASGKPAPWDI